MPEGTNIAVRNIFYSLPARRKFLKSDNTELRQIIAEFSHVALCRPDVGVRLSHNGKDIYTSSSASSRSRARTWARNSSTCPPRPAS